MFDTIFPADSAEFCPTEGLHDVFAVGTYKLDENEPPNAAGHQHRRGQCLIFRMNQDKNAFEKIQTFDLPAILDMKWCHRTPATLAVADSESKITLLEWDIERKMLKQAQSIACTNSTANLCLSLDWSNRRHPGTSLGSLIVSLSNGSLSLLYPSDSELTIETSWHAHDFEPWIAAWDYWDANVVYSGGDDLKLKGWDMREDSRKAIFTNDRFDAGITSIQSHPHVEHLIAVGSYDNTVRIFDTRKPVVPLCGVDVGGGAWRVKWHPSTERKNDLLVACMQDGFKVVKFAITQESDVLSANSGDIVMRFDEHNSLAYGVDWSLSPQGDADRKTTVASASFYDHSLRIGRA